MLQVSLCQINSKEYFAAVALRKQLLASAINFYRETNYLNFILVENHQVLAVVCLSLNPANFVRIREVAILPDYHTAYYEQLLIHFIAEYFKEHSGFISLRRLEKTI